MSKLQLQGSTRLIRLPGFLNAEISKLAEKYGFSLDEIQIEQLVHGVSRNPYLLQMFFRKLRLSNLDFIMTLQEILEQPRIYNSYLQELQDIVFSNSNLNSAFSNVLSGKSLPYNSPEAKRLLSLDLVKKGQNDQAIIRCQLYQNYFSNNGSGS